MAVHSVRNPRGGPRAGARSPIARERGAPMTRTEWHFRQAGPADAERLSVLGQATFLETYAETVDGDDIVAHCIADHSPAAYAALLATPGVRAWIVETVPARAPVAFLLLVPATLPGSRPGELEVSRVYVLSRFHGRAIGRELVRRAVAAARDAGAARLLLGVYSRNAQAIGFYERLGFARIGSYEFPMRGRGYHDHVMALALRD